MAMRSFGTEEEWNRFSNPTSKEVAILGACWFVISFIFITMAIIFFVFYPYFLNLDVEPTKIYFLIPFFYLLALIGYLTICPYYENKIKKDYDGEERKQLLKVLNRKLFIQFMAFVIVVVAFAYFIYF